MKGAVQIAKFANIPVFVHWSFGLILMWVVGSAMSEGADLELIIWAVSFVLALFACVVMHEYGHALTARKYGVSTKDIILSPIGGVARLERLPEKPLQEFYIAIAGPLVNVAIAIGLSPYFLLGQPSLSDFFKIFTEAGEIEFFTPFQLFIPALIGINISLAVFNMLPAFPMDGGRVLRSLLSMKVGRLRATQVASYIGQFLAVALVCWGIFNYHFVTVLIGFFVFYTAASEYSSVKVDEALSTHTVLDLMRPTYTHIDESDSMQKAIDELKRGVEKSFLVWNMQHQVKGVLHEEAILAAMKKGDMYTTVDAYTSDDFEAIYPQESLKAVFYKMQTQGYSILPVYQNGLVVGVVDVSMLNNFLRLQQQMKFGK